MKSNGYKVKRPRGRGSKSNIPIKFIALVVAAAAIFLLFRLIMRDTVGEKDGESSNASSSSLTSSANSEQDTSSLSSQTEEESKSENYDSLEPAKEMDISQNDIEKFNTMMIANGRGYRYYDFSEDNSIEYIEMIKGIADQYKDKSNIYSIIVPTATDIMIPQSILVDIDTSDQQKACEYLYASINAVAPSVRTVPIYDILKANCDKEIFFKTDRNWTSLGAYYAYRQFCKIKMGIPVDLSKFKKEIYENFVGSFFKQSNEAESMGLGEILEVYVPQGNINVNITDFNGEKSSGSLICDVTDYDEDMKFCAFLGGDYPYIEVNNKDIKDGSSCLLIKDSYGSVLAPYLSLHYENMYIIDYRYYDGDLNFLLGNVELTDIIVENHIESTSDAETVSGIKQLFE